LFTRGALRGLAAFLYVVALSRILAGEANLLNITFPILATALVFFTLRERLTVHLAIGLIIASLGVFLVLGGGTASFSLGWGELAGIASAILGAGAGAGAVNAIRALRRKDNGCGSMIARTEIDRISGIGL
jgi:drug/metabolite transporter (DMT)-like permease